MILDTPFVSVIVPVYNDPSRIQSCVEALLAQTYPQDCYEVIVVDNGSTDGTVAAVRGYPVILLVESDTRSSYAARNRGLAQARGSIIAFTDSDCTPASQWIAAGVEALERRGADLVGGNVRFVASSRPTGAEIYDSLSNMQMEKNIRERGVAKTANLFVRASVVEAVGPFPATLQSGGDVVWTQGATSQGFKLVYAPEAEVAHPTRRLGALLKKQFRVGKGQSKMRARTRAVAASVDGSQQSKPARRASKISRLQQKVFGTLKGFMPASLELFEQSARQQQLRLSPAALYRVWFAGWLCRIATTLGSLASAVRA